MDVSARAIARAERDVLAELSRRDPALLGSYRDHVRRATQIVGDRLARAATVEHVALDDLSDAAQRQLGNCVANYALALLGAQQRAHRLRGEAGAGHTMLSWARAQRRADPDRSVLAFFEQWVIDGHPLHPATKVREPMTAADVLDTSPEWGNVVPLAVAALAPTIAVEHGGPADSMPSSGGALTRLLLAEHPGLDRALADEGLPHGSSTLIPLHPWQVRNVVAERYGPQQRSWELRLLKPTIPARPLVSYRTLVPLATPRARHPHHLKTSLSVQLTNAVRGNSPAATHNAPALSALLTEILSAEAGFDGRLTVLAEPASARFAAPGSTTDDDSSGLSRSAAVSAIARQNPEEGLGATELVLPTGALWATSPLSDQPILGELLDELRAGTPLTRAQAAELFARHYARLVLPPILTLLTKYGVAMEAHGENTLLVLRAGRPVRCVLRDLGGIRIHPGRLAGVQRRVDLLPGSHLATDDADELRNKTYYAQFVNDAGQLVSCLARLSGAPPGTFWRHLAAAARATFDTLARQPGTRKAACADAEALLSRPWPHKALLSMWLTGAVTDYIYLPVPNPLSQLP
ncbi:MAG TPA: IucA/IucC family protein [Pseudonocardia sp.]|nr:IucA/IucC family protein [Pseudonocardia sp.]